MQVSQLPDLLLLSVGLSGAAAFVAIIDVASQQNSPEVLMGDCTMVRLPGAVASMERGIVGALNRHRCGDPSGLMPTPSVRALILLRRRFNKRVTGSMTSAASSINSYPKTSVMGDVEWGQGQ